MSDKLTERRANKGVTVDSTQGQNIELTPLIHWQDNGDCVLLIKVRIGFNASTAKMSELQGSVDDCYSMLVGMHSREKDKGVPE